MSRRPVLPSAAIDYPSSDGKPLAENDAQLRAILYAVGALRVRYGEAHAALRTAEARLEEEAAARREETAARRAAQRRAEREAAARRAAEARIAELEARLGEGR